MGEGNAEDNAKEEKKKGGAGGEEEGGGGDEQQAGGKPKGKKKGGGDGNNNKAPSAVVLRVDLHCEGCARKVKKAIKAAQGVKSVATDMAGGTVTVGGKADPWELKERIESRARKAVAFVSPPNPPKKKKDDDGAEGKKKTAASAGKDGKAKKELPESTVVVKVRLHCKGCIDRIKRTAHKIKGVKQVAVDTAKEHVTVKGTMDAATLPDVLRSKLKREVVLVPPPKKDGGDGDKKKKQAGGDEDKGGKQGNGKKKNKSKDGAEEAVGLMPTEQPFPMAMMYGAPGGPSSYRVEMLHAPQLFSDENPNACAVM